MTHRRMTTHRESRDETLTMSSPRNAPMSSARIRPEPADWWSDRYKILLLVLLYTIQGFPIGFVFGSIPFLLKENTGFDELAVFSFAGWPYSIKLLVAPFVDSVYSVRLGRRKSWILPVQSLSGFLMFSLSTRISSWVSNGKVWQLTPTFFAVMFLTATQDIAVDAWALTLLQKKNLAYASTAQSIGISIGYFSSFTIFLALQNEAFSNSYVRPWWGGSGAVLNLALALQMIGVLYLILTTLIFVVPEGSSLADTLNHKNDDVIPLSPAAGTDPELLVNSSKARSTWQTIQHTYKELYGVLRLPAVRKLLVVLLFAKTGFSAYDNVSALKLLDLGFPKETMATLAVLQAPVSLAGSVLSGRWASKSGPIEPYLYGFGLRFVFSLTGPVLVRYFSSLNGVVTPLFYVLVLVSSTFYLVGGESLMFVAASAFFLSVSERNIGGSYLTLLNTTSNLGGMWHKSITLFLVDRLTIHSACDMATQADSRGLCPIAIDGYYVVSFFLIPVAIYVGFYVSRTLRQLEALPESAWRTS